MAARRVSYWAGVINPVRRRARSRSEDSRYWRVERQLVLRAGRGLGPHLSQCRVEPDRVLLSGGLARTQLLHTNLQLLAGEPAAKPFDLILVDVHLGS